MKLSTSTIDAITKPGRHSDGRNLYLNVSKTGAKSWVFMWQQDGRQREAGLGSYTGAGRVFSVSLKQARLAADKMRTTIASGIDPIVVKVKAKIAAVTFRELLEQTIADIVAPKSKASNREHNVKQWRNSLAAHAAIIMDKPAAAITTDDMLTILRPIWSKRKLGELVRSRIETVLRKGGKLIVENVAVWHGNLDGLLAPKQKKADAKSHASLDHRKLPAIVATLSKRDGMAAKALLNAILSGGRTEETLSMRHDELDLDAGLWVIPAERMKAGKKHSVMLSAQHVDLLRTIAPVEGNPFVFVGTYKDTGRLSPQALRDMLNKPASKGGLGIAATEATPHGFRATFTDWAGDMGFETEIAELATAHGVKGVRKFYRRGAADVLRAQLMQAYADHAFGVSNVVPMLRREVAA